MWALIKISILELEQDDSAQNLLEDKTDEELDIENVTRGEEPDQSEFKDDPS